MTPVWAGVHGPGLKAARATARHAALLLLTVALIWGHAAPALAHEIGATQIAATFDADRYTIDVAVDPDALLTRLQMAAGEAPSPALRRDERDERIGQLGAAFLQSVSLVFDGRAADPRFEYRPVSSFSDLAQTPSTVRLSGEVPSGARVFTLSYGLAAGTFATVVRVGRGAAQTVWMEGGKASPAIALAAARPPARLEMARRYFALGFAHIVPRGIDHILFALGLWLLSPRWKPVLQQITMFTIAHAITLGLTFYGVVSLPARVVEPLIALCIAYVAIENMFTTEVKPWRIALVFSFGLLHGMGVAGVLRETGLPRGGLLTALVTFNAGVEAAQLTVVALAFLLLGSDGCLTPSRRRLVMQPASMVMALVGVCWTLQRLW